MEQDIAKEPVDLTDDAEFMDTGVLHEERPCVQCGQEKAQQGKAYCKTCQVGGVKQ